MKNTLLHTKESIILKSIEIISQLGIQGLTTKEIAARQGISEGTIFRHYKTKNDIISAVLDRFSQFDLDIIESLKMKSLSFDDAMIYYITSFAEYYENYPEIASITHAYEGLMNTPELAEKIKTILGVRENFVEHLVEMAKRNEEISDIVDTKVLSDIIQGSFLFTIQKWKMNQYCFSLKERALEILASILKHYKL